MNEKFDKVIKEWDEITSKYADFGAADSEPTIILERKVIGNFLHKGVNVLPLNALQWELYSDFDGVEIVAGHLNEQAQKILDVLGSLPYHEVSKIIDYYDF